MVDRPRGALEAARRAADLGCDLVEFRVDGFFSGSSPPGRASERSPEPVDDPETAALLTLVSGSPLPCIVTCRSAAEGGLYDGEEPARAALLLRLCTAPAPPRYLDVELSAYERSENLRQKINLAIAHPGQLRDVSTGLILSVHDPAGRPPDLSRKLLALRAHEAAAVHKVALLARSVRDNLELFEILAEADRPTIALAMGEAGLLSRVLAPKFGGFLTFASLGSGHETAPGQPSVAELTRTYRFRSIGRATRVFGVLGWPVSGSLSPRSHNAAFAAHGVDAVYLPVPVPPEFEHFKATLLSLVGHARLDFAGCSVTTPHKQNLVRLARAEGWELDPLAAACGAANTLVLPASGTRPAPLVANTDGPALVEVVRQTGAGSTDRVAILGAGGLARASVLALARRGGRVSVLNRTPERALALVRDLAPHAAPGTIEARPLAPESLRDARVIINCTSAGQAGGPDPDAAPVELSALRWLGPARPVLIETVYAPRWTPLMGHAQAAGLRIVDGLRLFLAQAALQSELFTARPAPLAAMESALLAPRASGAGDGPAPG